MPDPGSRRKSSIGKCGWQGEDFGDAQKLLVAHLIHALSGVLSE